MSDNLFLIAPFPTIRLGLVPPEATLSPIDVHTPLWLWGRKGFPAIS